MARAKKKKAQRMVVSFFFSPNFASPFDKAGLTLGVMAMAVCRCLWYRQKTPFKYCGRKCLMSIKNQYHQSDNLPNLPKEC